MKTPKTKTAALLEAKNALKDYLKKHKLNPMKDYREDSVHGKEVTRLVTRLNIERDKVLDKYPYNDITNETKLVKMKEKKLKAKDVKHKGATKKEDKAAKKAKVAPETSAKTEGKEKKAPKAATLAKYDYPLIDGREMNAAEKKKYRAEQRRIANGGEAKPKKEKAEKKTPKTDAPAAEAPKKGKKAKKAEKAAVPEKPLKDKKKAKKVKKAKNEVKSLLVHYFKHSKTLRG